MSMKAAVLMTALLLAGCGTTRTGHTGEECMQYTPWCPDRTICEIDENGCEVCNCIDVDDPRWERLDPDDPGAPTPR